MTGMSKMCRWESLWVQKAEEKEWQGRGRAEKQAHKDVKGRKESADCTNKCKEVTSSALSALNQRKSWFHYLSEVKELPQKCHQRAAFISKPIRWIRSPMTPTLIFPMMVLSKHQMRFNQTPTISFRLSGTGHPRLALTARYLPA